MIFSETALSGAFLTAGAIFDVTADIRLGSRTFGKWFSVELSVEVPRMLFIPAGCAHGFVTLRDETVLFYQMGDFYHPESARGFRWNDPFFDIPWPAEPSVIAERDRGYADFDPSSV